MGETRQIRLKSDSGRDEANKVKGGQSERQANMGKVREQERQGNKVKVGKSWSGRGEANKGNSPWTRY